VEEARRSLEEKAEQLTLTSKYKSEFLANMSHELRTPLNSLLILAQQLYENAEGNLNDKQIRYAKTIHSCGDDLIQLINDILDLSKIESGFISANFGSVRFGEIAGFVETTFKPISEARHLRFNIETDATLPAIIQTDQQRLNQILKNLLSNSFKFTEKGEVKLKIYLANKNWKPGNSVLDSAKKLRPLPSAIQVSVSRRKNRISFSKRSSRQKVLPAVNMAVPVWVCLSAVVWPNCLAERLNWKVHRAREVHSLYLSR
jgi:signal transduction histidine kinase